MNQAFIDGQNLIYTIKNTKKPWRLDLCRFYVYLRNKYDVDTAYYFIGCHDKKYEQLYKRVKDAGFDLVFRAHANTQCSAKKGNVDTDIVFTILRNMLEHELSGKVILVSGDGDYYKLVNYLIEKDKFCKLLAPDQKVMSSLYKSLNTKYYAFLSNEGTVKKIKSAGPA